MCLKVYLGFRCGHCSVPYIKPCPQVWYNPHFPICSILGEYREGLYDFCHPCAREAHKHKVIMDEESHRQGHLAGNVCCNFIFPGETAREAERNAYFQKRFAEAEGLKGQVSYPHSQTSAIRPQLSNIRISEVTEHCQMPGAQELHNHNDNFVNGPAVPGSGTSVTPNSRGNENSHSTDIQGAHGAGLLNTPTDSLTPPPTSQTPGRNEVGTAYSTELSGDGGFGIELSGFDGRTYGDSTRQGWSSVDKGLAYAYHGYQSGSNVPIQREPWEHNKARVTEDPFPAISNYTSYHNQDSSIPDYYENRNRVSNRVSLLNGHTRTNTPIEIPYETEYIEGTSNTYGKHQINTATVPLIQSTPTRRREKSRHVNSRRTNTPASTGTNTTTNLKPLPMTSISRSPPREQKTMTNTPNHYPTPSEPLKTLSPIHPPQFNGTLHEFILPRRSRTRSCVSLPANFESSFLETNSYNTQDSDEDTVVEDDEETCIGEDESPPGARIQGVERKAEEQGVDAGESSAGAYTEAQVQGFKRGVHDGECGSAGETSTTPRTHARKRGGKGKGGLRGSGFDSGSDGGSSSKASREWECS